MVEDRVTDGRRVGQLLASEIRGRTSGPIGELEVVDVRDVDGSASGEFAYGIDRRGERIASVFVREEGAVLAVQVQLEVARTAAERTGLAVSDDTADDPRTPVLVDSGAAVKRALSVLEAVVEALEDGGGSPAGADRT